MDGARLEVFADLYAISRNRNGDPFNCLHPTAGDSTMILGQVYAPPGDFVALEMLIEFADVVSINSGFFPVQILVENPFPPPPAFQRIPTDGSSRLMSVREGQRTQVVVTVDLDSTLVRRAETFLKQPYIYISSVEPL